MPAPAFAVSAMTVLRETPRFHDSTVLAYLTVEFGPLCIVGASFVLTDDRLLRVWLPRLGRARVFLIDRAARDQLTEIASASYRGLSGRDPADMPLAKAPLVQEPSHVSP